VDRQRLLDLLASNAVSQSDADKAAEALQVAEADLARSIAAIAEARGQVLVAEKTLLHRKEQLAFTRILAPYDGLVIRRDRDPGEMLVPGSSLLQLISLDEIWVSAWVDETAVSKVSAAMPARVVFRSEPGKDYPGVVSRVGRETDRETREFLVNVRVTEWPANWTIGQRAEVFIETARASAVPVIPEEWLVWRDRLPGVFVPVDGVARWREVALGLHGSRRVAVTSGLQAGDVVIRHRDAPEKPPLEGRRLSLP
jgi:HlyD family secretion protein